MATYYWRGTNGGFALPAGWQMPNGMGMMAAAAQPPDENDVAVLDTTGMALSADASFGGAFHLDLPGAAGVLNLNGHRLSLLNTLQLGDSGSTVTGGGTLETDAVSAVPDMGGATALLVAGGVTWSNAGLAIVGGAVALGAGAADSATILNQPGALLALAGDQMNQIAASGAGGRILNSGTLAKTAGDGLSSLSAPVTNTGVIQASSGTLELTGGGMLGGTIGGDAGQVRLAGTFALPLGTAGMVSFGSGAQWGAAGDGAAVLSGPGTLATTGPVRLTDWSGMQLQLAGGATWQNGGSVVLAAGLAFGASPGDGGTLVNQLGGFLGFAGDTGMDAMSPALAMLVNSGTLAKTAGAGTSRIAAAVAGSGSVVIGSGTLEFDGGGTLDGPISGPGLLAIGGGSMALGAPVGGDLAINGGAVSLAAGATMGGALRLAAGTLALGTQGLAMANLVAQTDGTLAGSGTLAAYAGAQLAGGLQTGAGATRLFGNSRMGGVALDGGRTLQNVGVLTWSDGSVVLGGGDAGAMAHAGTLSNTGLLRITAAGTIGPAAGGSGVLDNAGVIAVAPASGETDLNAMLANQGMLLVTSGTLSLNGGGMSSGGQLQVSPGAALRVGAGGDAFHITAGMYGVGSTWVDGGTLDLGGAGGIAAGASLSITHGGTLLLGGLSAAAASLGLVGGGMLSGTGTLVISGAAQFGDGAQSGAGRTVLSGGGAIAGAMQLDGGRTLENDGTLSWNAGAIALGSGDSGALVHAGTLLNAASGLWQVAADGSVAAAGSSAVVNAGTMVRSGGSGVASIAAPLTNSGTVAVQGGSLFVAGPVSGDGTFLLEGGRLDFAGVVDAGETIRFVAGGTLGVDTAGPLGGIVSGFGAGDALDLTAVGFGAATHLGFADGTLTVGDGTHTAAISLNGSYAPGGFSMAADGHGGVLIGYVGS